jgi:hypothetical protein
MPARILHVDLDAFFVEVCRQRNPELRDIELLVVGGRRDQRGVVQSASYGARRYGIHAGMPIQAVRLSPRPLSSGLLSHYREASHAARGRAVQPHRGDGLARRAYLDFGGTGGCIPGSCPWRAASRRRTSGDRVDWRRHQANRMIASSHPDASSRAG